MSSVSSIGGNGVDLHQLLLQTSGQTQTSSGTGSALQISSTDQSENTQATESTHGHHHHHGGLGKARANIEQSVTNALNSSDGSTDPNKIVQDAIAKALQGTNPASIQQGGQTNGTDGKNDGDQDDAGGAQAAQNSSTSQSAFVQLLKAHGIDPQQFQQDLQAAIQQANGGKVDFSQAFSSFPPGSTVDTTA